MTTAQFRDTEAGAERLAEHIIQSIDDVFDWYDGPIFLAYVVNKYDIIPDDAKPFVIGPSSAEQALADGFSASGSLSAGSMDPFTIPHIILGMHAAHAIGTELFDDDADARGEIRSALGLYKALMYTEIMTQGVKTMVYRVRPDQSDTRSFFSGHTSTTFTMSSYMQREIDDALLNWKALSSTPMLRDALRASSFTLLYGWAAYVGYSRMSDNKHYLIDVLVGATIGTLIGNFVYDSVIGGDGSFPAIGILSSGNGPQLAIQMQL